MEPKVGALDQTAETLEHLCYWCKKTDGAQLIKI